MTCSFLLISGARCEEDPLPSVPLHRTTKGLAWEPRHRADPQPHAPEPAGMKDELPRRREGCYVLAPV